MKNHFPDSENIKGHTNVLEVVKNHLEESVLFTNEEYRPTGGIFISPKPKSARLDVIILNTLGAIHFKETNAAIGIVNINVQHEDQERIDLLSKVIANVMDEAFKDGYLFTTGKDPILFKLSRTLLSRNIRTRFEKENYTIGE